MEITIVEPCPECGSIPNKFTATQEENDCAPRLHIECPQCGWTSGYEHTNPSMVLSKWNDRVSNRRIEKTAKPCPFCSSISVVLDYYNCSYFVVCTHCGCKTAYCNTKEDAIKAWNKRPDSDE